MLTEEDPAKKAQEESEKKKKEAEEKTKEEKKKTEHGIRKGMRAVTFSLDQRSLASTSMLELGDFVDVLIMEEKEGKQKTHKYKGLKVIAIDGITQKEKEKERESLLSSAGLGSSVGNIINIMNAKQVTLEVKEVMVETMLKQAGQTGIIIAIRNQDELLNEEEQDIDLGDGTAISVENNILNEILAVNHHNSMDKLLRAREQKESAANNVENIIDNINIANGMYSNRAVKALVNNNFEKIAKKAADDAKKAAEEEMKKTLEKAAGDAKKAAEEEMKKTLEKELKKIKKADSQDKTKSADAPADSAGINKISSAVSGGMQAAAKTLGIGSAEVDDALSGGFEIISGKIVGEEVKMDTEEKKATIYKKLTTQEVKFEEDGSIMDPNKKEKSIGDKVLSI
jgi:hypothetical protein